MFKKILNYFKPKYRIAMRLVENNDKEIIKTNFIIQQRFLFFWIGKSIGYGSGDSLFNNIYLENKIIFYDNFQDAVNDLNKFIKNKNICKYRKNKIIIVPSNFNDFDYYINLNSKNNVMSNLIGYGEYATSLDELKLIIDKRVNRIIIKPIN